MTPLYIFDLDGTLALIEHRRHHVSGEKKDWRAFFAACVDDVPNPAVIDVLQALSVRSEIWVWSGRSDEVTEATHAWIEEHIGLGLVYSLMMRREGDHSPDDKLKLAWYNEMSESDKARLMAVFDDRDRMVALWRGLGVTCFQVAPGDF